MKIEVGVATDIGRVREGNEDSYLVDPPLYAVADGMGGHRGGEVASELALETIESLFREGATTLVEQVRQANRAVFARSQEDRAVSGMGTTLTAAHVEGGAVRLAHVGDSRAYLLRAGALRQLTDDHTLVNRMVKAGEITESEAEVHPHRNVLTRSLGTEAEVHIDEEQVPLMDGDRVLLCSDGLFGMVAEDQIQAILEAEPAPQRAADRLIKAANRAGGVDNITAIVLDVHDDGVEEAPALDPGAADLTPGERVLRRNAPTIRRWIAGAVIALVLFAGSLVALRAYVDRQWYVGVADGKVAIYQGIPATPLGYDLHSVAEVTEIDATAAEALTLYAALPEGISANSREGATAIVEQIRTDLAGVKPPKKAPTP
ncbi:MAG: Stp1/IreP family PP2C-type Ser/Thr phosphatase [Actinomycetota bacterium]